MYHTEPDILPMLGDRRRHPIAVKTRQRARTADEDSAAGGCDGVQRIVYIAPLEVLVTCERERGASIWEAGGRMRLLARLPHGRNAIQASLIQGTSPRMSAEHRRRIGASSTAGGTAGGAGLLDVCATVLDCVHVPGTPAPDGGQAAHLSHQHAQGVGKPRDGAGRLHDGRIITTGMDPHPNPNPNPHPHPHPHRHPHRHPHPNASPIPNPNPNPSQAWTGTCVRGRSALRTGCAPRYERRARSSVQPNPNPNPKPSPALRAPCAQLCAT